MTQKKPRVVVHEDDLGMSHSANVAFGELTKLGVCTSGAVMVPCPWFLEIAEMQAKDPRLDIGVHLTLNAENPLYRWRPLTGVSQASGLVDPDGYLWRTVPELRAHAHPDAVEAELRAQVEAAKIAGIDITHLDSHCFCVMCPQFIDMYVRLGQENRVPVLLLRPQEAYENVEGGLVEMDEAIRVAEAHGDPVFDILLETPWVRRRSAQEDYDELMKGISPGLTYMALHFNTPGDIEAQEPGGGHLRIEEYELFRSDWFRSVVAARELELIGMRGFRDRLRGEAGAVS